MSSARPFTFDDWVDYFRKWQQDIDLDPSITAGYQFDARYGGFRMTEIKRVAR